MTLDARAAGRTHDGGVRRTGWKLEAVAGRQLDGLLVRADEERDRALGTDEQLREAVLVRRVAIAGPVAPLGRLDTRGAQVCR